ncbi:UBP-type zinc finger domain-containing protein [Rathayibacter caricis]|uniref:UBP-type zinc finger domain-containing protein n=1 Tax=Rathayibacter caricis TaxID=110936 RepID=UPI001FB3831F|nr:UBP-type zinc finger domain-containing protein [Rathayibacter caricis]MCJ1697496.1 UBP-type zinc finger domain-containing protein [Rathayibacter caricis]
MTATSMIGPSVPPSGAGCVECDRTGAWWVHLRRCALCGHIGCCDDSPNRHATAHYETTGHAVIRSFEPGEDWFWDYRTGDYADGPRLADPQEHPLDQTAPGPADRLPADWREQLDAGR